MPDQGHPTPAGPAPRDWHDALAALPLDTPDVDGWARLAARLPIKGDAAGEAIHSIASRPSSTRRRHRRRLAWLAAVAALMAIAVVPVQLLRHIPDDGTPHDGVLGEEGPPAAADAIDTRLAPLYAESARLEALVAMARDDSMASAPATVLTASLDDRIARIDGHLAQPGLGDGQRMDLWQSRIEVLRELAGVEATQLWLSARGEHWDTALVQVD